MSNKISNKIYLIWKQYLLVSQILVMKQKNFQRWGKSRLEHLISTHQLMRSSIVILGTSSVRQTCSLKLKIISKRQSILTNSKSRLQWLSSTMMAESIKKLSLIIMIDGMHGMCSVFQSLVIQTTLSTIFSFMLVMFMS